MKAWGCALTRFWAARGFFVLTALCLILIAGAAVYGRARFIAAPRAESGRASARQAVAPAITAQPTAPPEPAPTAAPALSWPVSGREIVRDYTLEPVWFEPLGLYETHPGVDIRARPGEEALASADGTVAFARFDAQCGYMVETQSEDGLIVRYGNLSKSLRISPGGRVRRGQAIGMVGASAPYAGLTGTFLHFEAFRSGERVALP